MGQRLLQQWLRSNLKEMRNLCGAILGRCLPRLFLEILSDHRTDGPIHFRALGRINTHLSSRLVLLLFLFGPEASDLCVCVLFSSLQLGSASFAHPMTMTDRPAEKLLFPFSFFTRKANDCACRLNLLLEYSPALGDRFLMKIFLARHNFIFQLLGWWQTVINIWLLSRKKVGAVLIKKIVSRWDWRSEWVK